MLSTVEPASSVRVARTRHSTRFPATQARRARRRPRPPAQQPIDGMGRAAGVDAVTGRCGPHVDGHCPAPAAWSSRAVRLPESKDSLVKNPSAPQAATRGPRSIQSRLDTRTVWASACWRVSAAATSNPLQSGNPMSHDDDLRSQAGGQGDPAPACSATLTSNPSARMSALAAPPEVSESSMSNDRPSSAKRPTAIVACWGGQPRSVAGGLLPNLRRVLPSGAGPSPLLASGSTTAHRRTISRGARHVHPRRRHRHRTGSPVAAARGDERRRGPATASSRPPSHPATPTTR